MRVYENQQNLCDFGESTEAKIWFLHQQEEGSESQDRSQTANETISVAFMEDFLG